MVRVRGVFRRYRDLQRKDVDALPWLLASGSVLPWLSATVAEGSISVKVQCGSG